MRGKPSDWIGLQGLKPLFMTRENVAAEAATHKDIKLVFYKIKLVRIAFVLGLRYLGPASDKAVICGSGLQPRHKVEERMGL